MIGIHAPDIGKAHRGSVKPACITLIVASLFAVPIGAADEDDQEVYDTFLSCAAFHTIEATRATGNAAAAHQATATDYAKAATAFAADGKAETTNADLKTMLDAFQEKLRTGEPRAMAEQWTALETSCAELHPLKDAIVKRRVAGATNSAPEMR